MQVEISLLLGRDFSKLHFKGMQSVMEIKEAVVTDFSLEAPFNELRCIMLQLYGLWSLFLADAGVHLFWQCLWCLVEGRWTTVKF